MPQQRVSLPRIISGGQTGADQGGLLAARACGFETGGWAPSNFYTEDGPAENFLQPFGLKDSGLNYVGRTKLNARDADLTIWFGKTGTAGYYATKKAVREAGKKFAEAELFSNANLAMLISGSACVNIAGNRESHNYEITSRTCERLILILKEVKKKAEEK